MDAITINQRTAETPAAAPEAAKARGRLGIRQIGLAVLLAIALFGGGWAGWMYWTEWRFQQSTDDAYVQAHNVVIAPQVSGYLVQVDVGDNQSVKAGDVLAVIDQRDYQAVVDQAKADVSEAQASIQTYTAQIAEQQAQVDQANAQIVADQANEVFDEQNSARYDALARSGYGSQQNAQQATAAIQSAKAVVEKDKAALIAVQQQISVLQAQLAGARATLAHNQAILQQAEINLGYTTIRAPVDGVVGERTLRVGQYVQPGTNLLAVVPLQAAFIVANYEETQLTDVKPGQQVAISVDRFPDMTIHGIVNSLAPASGQEFSLLPPDNATGNFTKIVQRIPVKITFDRNDPLAGNLLPGMSVTTTIDVRTTPATTSPQG